MLFLFWVIPSTQQLPCVNSQYWSDGGPNSGSALQCGLSPLAGQPPARSAWCSWILEPRPHPPQTTASSVWTSCAATVFSPPAQKQAHIFFLFITFNRNNGQLNLKICPKQFFFKHSYNSYWTLLCFSTICKDYTRPCWDLCWVLCCFRCWAVPARSGCRLGACVGGHPDFPGTASLQVS